MLKYTVKRSLLILPILLGVTIIVFCIINAIPGDPAQRLLGPGATQDQIDLLNKQLGYDQPLLVRLWRYVSNIFTGFDFGNSYQNGKPVLHIIAINFKYTFRLAILQTLCYATLGIVLGVLSAVKQYSALDNVVRVISVSLAAFPGFWVYMLAILVFSLKLDWLPASGIESWKSYILPVGCASVLSASSLQRLTRTTMLESIRQDFVRTARAKGCAKGTVIWRHAFLNAMLPVLNQVGISFGYLLGGTVITEAIFAMPGLGSVIVTAINAKDVPLVMGSTVFLSAIFCLLIVGLDLASALLDPRVKAKLMPS